MKTCFKCHTTKPLSEYYTHKPAADGYLNKCKDCARADSHRYFLEKKKDEGWVEKEKERNREKFFRLGYGEKYKPTPEQSRVRNSRNKMRYPEKRIANNAVQRFPRETPNGQLHHWSYREEHRKDVIELSIKEHARLHRHIKYDSSLMLYRTKTGELLDTKERHLNYFKSLPL